MKYEPVTPSNVSSLSKFEATHVRPKPGRTLIVGSQVYKGREDRRLKYSYVVGVDMLPGPGVDVVLNMEEEHDLGLFDHVECLSVLEHSPRPWLLAANIQRLMKPGASLFVAVPLVWGIHGYPNDYWRMTPEGVKLMFPEIRWEALMLAGRVLHAGPKMKVIKDGGFPYLPRTETAGFGYK